MSNIVIFDSKVFREYYPQFADFSDKQLNQAWKKAQIICNNSPKSPVTDLIEREILLELLTAHFCSLEENGNILGTPSLVTQGSVSLSLNLPKIPKADWYLQSQYGASYWQMTMKYRSGKYYAKSA